jgi:hypothetical protein
MNMRIVAVACVRDEIDIIEAFVRHNLAHVTRLIVLDNGSSDGTIDILNALQREGLPLDVLQDPSPGKYLSRRMTRLMREQAIGRHGAHWVLPLDADEFASLGSDGILVPDNANGDKPLELPWRSFLPSADDDSAEPNPVVRIQHCLAEESNPLAKVVVPATLGCRTGAALEPGNHEFSVASQTCAAVRHEHAWLAHFPVRSRGQFVAKTVIGHLQNLAMPFHNPRWGAHHQNYFNMLQRDATAFSADFAAWLRTHGVYQFSFSPVTVRAPLVYRGGTLRYTPKPDEIARSWHPVLSYAQDLARRYGLLQASLTDEQRLSLDQQLDIFTYFREQLERREQHLNQKQHQLDVAQARIQALESENARIHRESRNLVQEKQGLARQLRNSWTWRVGSMALWPARLVRGGMLSRLRKHSCNE